MRKVLAVVVFSTLLASCGGGGGGGSSTSAVPSSPQQPQMVQGSIIVVMPSTVASSAVASARARAFAHVRPMYIAPTTNGATWTAVGTNQTSGTYSGVADLSSGSPLCVPSGGGGRSCTIPFSVPSGSYTFTLKTYDQAPVSGAIPSGAKQLAVSVLTQTITANQTNSLLFLLSAIVGGITTTNGLGAATYFSTPGDGTSHTVGIGVTVTDPDGNVVTGAALYASAIPVSLTETGGTGHMTLLINGTASGTSGSITKPADTLAVQYDGGGATTDYAKLSLGSSSPVLLTVSPMFVSPGSAAINKLVATSTLNIVEPGATASSGIAYSVTPNACPSAVNGSVSGSNASATGTVTINVAGGTNTSCNVYVADILGTNVKVPYTFAVPGPLIQGTITGSNFTGDCSSTNSATNRLSFAGSGATATITLSDPGYSGAISASSDNTNVATASVSGATLSITSGATAGTATISASDTAGNSFTCYVGTTITGGSVQ